MFYKLKIKNYKLNEGMSYVELIVVLSIFSIMSSIVLFNYQDFQSKIEIKSLANDIALKIVEIQKDASAGRLPLEPIISPSKSYYDSWKPSYGIYFDLSVDYGNNKAFDRFADLNNDGICNSLDDPNNYSCVGKGAESFRDYIYPSIDINPKYKISDLAVFCPGNIAISVNNLSIVFTRSDPSANIKTSPDVGCAISSAKIGLSSESSSSINSNVTVYSSGRIQIN